MTRINLLFPPEEIVTGGNVYDDELFTLLRQDDRMQVAAISDKDLKCCHRFLWSLFALLHIRRIGRCKYVFMNSSRFPQTLPFLLLFRVLYPKVGVITIHHHFMWRQLAGLKQRIYYRMERSFLKHCSYVITPNPYVQAELETFIPSSRILFHELSFDKSPRRQSVYNKGQLLFVGTIEERKGLKYLVEALAKLPKEIDFHLDIVGKVISEPYYRSLCERIAQCGLSERISFRGRVSAEELHRYYQEAHCFTFPSLHEGYGIVLIEAMSYGLPVIAFDNSAIPYTVKDAQNGLLAKDMDSASLAKNITAMLTDTALHAHCSEGALATYTQVPSKEDFARNTKKLISKLLSEK